MEPANSRFNPFALLISPEAVLAALERSSSLGQLGSRIRRPLDERLARQQANQEAQVGELVLEDLVKGLHAGGRLG